MNVNKAMTRLCAANRHDAHSTLDENVSRFFYVVRKVTANGRSGREI